MRMRLSRFVATPGTLQMQLLSAKCAIDTTTLPIILGYYLNWMCSELPLRRSEQAQLTFLAHSSGEVANDNNAQS